MVKKGKMIKTRKFNRNQINLIKISNEDLRIINEYCKCQNINEIKKNENKALK